MLNIKYLSNIYCTVTHSPSKFTGQTSHLQHHTQTNHQHTIFLQEHLWPYKEVAVVCCLYTTKQIWSMSHTVLHSQHDWPYAAGLDKVTVELLDVWVWGELPLTFDLQWFYQLHSPCTFMEMMPRSLHQVLPAPCISPLLCLLCHQAKQIMWVMTLPAGGFLP